MSMVMVLADVNIAEHYVTQGVTDSYIKLLSQLVALQLCVFYVLGFAFYSFRRNFSSFLRKEKQKGEAIFILHVDIKKFKRNIKLHSIGSNIFSMISFQQKLCLLFTPYKQQKNVCLKVLIA